MKGPREEFAESGDPVQEIYENVRDEALRKIEPGSWAMERVRQYGVVGLFPGFHNDFPFILYTQSVPRPAWSGKTDFHQEKLQQIYEFLITACGEIHEGRDVGGDPQYVRDECLFASRRGERCVDALSTVSG